LDKSFDIDEALFFDNLKPSAVIKALGLDSRHSLEWLFETFEQPES
jgi:hypothetical protein